MVVGMAVAAQDGAKTGDLLAIVDIAVQVLRPIVEAN